MWIFVAVIGSLILGYMIGHYATYQNAYTLGALDMYDWIVGYNEAVKRMTDEFKERCKKENNNG